MARWEELPQEILELIACRLAIDDFLAFRGVCTSWRFAAAKETYEAKSKAPWLMIYGCNGIPEFFSPSRGRISIYRGTVVGSQALSPPGWILESNTGCEYRIFNPLSRVSIKLPALEKLRRRSHLNVEHDGLGWLLCGCPRIDRIALSSSPSLPRSYTVMISFRRGLLPQEFAFHRSGEDAWTLVSPGMVLPLSIVRQLIYYDGLFVALDAHNQIKTLNERERQMKLRLVLGQNFDGFPHLVECSGSLLVAWKIRGEGDEPVKKIRVFHVDLEKGTQKEVKSLGNASLFLNDGSSSSFSVKFNAESCLPGIQPNHVYFTDYRDQKKKSYSMDNGKVGTYFDATSCHQYAANWFQPDF